MAEYREYAGRQYAIQFHCALPDDAWCVELSEAIPAPPAWAGIPGAERHLPGAAFLTALVPDEDPELEPTIHIHSRDEHVIPYEIMRWFMEKVSEEVARCRAVLAQRGREADASKIEQAALHTP